MFDLVAPFVVGFFGSLHCVGMCGPLILAYSLHIQGHGNSGLADGASVFQRSVFHHTAFHVGRLLTDGFLGALAGWLAYLIQTDRFFFNVRIGVTLVSGTLMVLAGLVLFRILPIPFTPAAPSFGHGSFSGPWISKLFRSKGVGSRMALGLATGFLPCMLSWSMMMKAASTQSFPGGFLTMLAFGLGTVPALFFTGLSASMLSIKLRFIGERVAALSIIVMGLILVFKGVRVLA